MRFNMSLHTADVLFSSSCVETQAFHQMDLFNWEEPSSLWASKNDKSTEEIHSSEVPEDLQDLTFICFLILEFFIITWEHVVQFFKLAGGGNPIIMILVVCCQCAKGNHGNPLQCLFSSRCILLVLFSIKSQVNLTIVIKLLNL